MIVKQLRLLARARPVKVVKSKASYSASIPEETSLTSRSYSLSG